MTYLLYGKEMQEGEAMIAAQDIQNSGFNSLLDFEDFRIEWIRVCARLSPESENARLRDSAEERYKLIRR